MVGHIKERKAYNMWMGGSYGCSKSALQAESQAYLHGLQWEKRENINCIMILTDCTTLVLSQRKTDQEIQINWITEEIKRIARTFEIYTVMKMGRMAVEQAHLIANRCRKDRVSFSSTILILHV